MNETSSRVRLMANLQAAVAEAVSGTMEERGRGFASDREAWAETLSPRSRKSSSGVPVFSPRNGRKRPPLQKSPLSARRAKYELPRVQMA